MSSILAAVGTEQLRKLDSMNNSRRDHAADYANQLQNIEGIECPIEPPGYKHVYQMFTIKLDSNFYQRNECVEYLRSVGIGASVHFDPPVHKHPIYQEFVDSSLPVTEKVSDEILTLPMFPSLKKREIFDAQMKK